MFDSDEFATNEKQSAEMAVLRKTVEILADAGIFEAKILLKYDQIHRRLMEDAEPFIRGAFPVKEAIAKDYFSTLCDIENKLRDFEYRCGIRAAMERSDCD